MTPFVMHSVLLVLKTLFFGKFSSSIAQWNVCPSLGFIPKLSEFENVALKNAQTLMNFRRFSMKSESLPLKNISFVDKTSKIYESFGSF